MNPEAILSAVEVTLLMSGNLLVKIAPAESDCQTFGSPESISLHLRIEFLTLISLKKSDNSVDELETKNGDNLGDR